MAAGLSSPVRPELEEGDAEPGAEQDGGADHMQDFQRENEVHAGLSCSSMILSENRLPLFRIML